MISKMLIILYTVLLVYACACGRGCIWTVTPEHEHDHGYKCPEMFIAE